jgi:hypothetical protein
MRREMREDRGEVPEERSRMGLEEEITMVWRGVYLRTPHSQAENIAK